MIPIPGLTKYLGEVKAVKRGEVKAMAMKFGAEANVEVEEEDWQLIILSLALCARLKPGLAHACGEAAKKLHGGGMFDELRKFSANVVQTNES